MKKALITGVSGQDGILLARYLLDSGYEVVGVSRSKSIVENHQNYTECCFDVFSDAFLSFLEKNAFDEVYHFAAISFVPAANADPVEAFRVNVSFVDLILRAIFKTNTGARVFLPSSASIYSGSAVSLQTEETPPAPRDIYGLTKCSLLLLARTWRDRGFFVALGVLYNHESSYRGGNFVTKKITDTAKKIAQGDADKLELGNLETIRDWSYAGDFVEGFQKMLIAEEADEFILASGQGRTIGDFCKVAFAQYDLNWRDFVVVNPEFYRESEEFSLVGDSSKAKKVLGWEPRMSFEDLVREISLSPQETLSK